MSAQKSSPHAAGGNGTIEIHYSRWFVFGGFAICVVTVAVWILGAILDPSLWSTAIFFVAVAFCGLIIWVDRYRTVLDPKPVVVLDGIGIRDKRLGSPVILWSRITSAEVENRAFASSTMNVGVTLHFEEFPYAVFIDLWPLDMNLNEFVEHMCHFVPHLQIDQSKNSAPP